MFKKSAKKEVAKKEVAKKEVSKKEKEVKLPLNPLVSQEVVWESVRGGNCFMRKRVEGKGPIFSAEKGNLRRIHSAKNSGVMFNKMAVDVVSEPYSKKNNRVFLLNSCKSKALMPKTTLKGSKKDSLLTHGSSQIEKKLEKMNRTDLTKTATLKFEKVAASLKTRRKINLERSRRHPDERLRSGSAASIIAKLRG